MRKNLPATDSAALEVARDLTRPLTQQKRLERLLTELRAVVPFEAAAVLLCQNDVLVPVAAKGLPRELLGRRFDPNEHPRLEAILASPGPKVFAADDPRPDPFDGMLMHNNEVLSVHSCMGAPLRVGDTTLGVLTADAVGGGRFSPEVVERFTFFAALGAAALQVGRYIEQLEDRLERGEEIVSALNRRPGVEIIGNSRPMRQLLEEVGIVAHSDLAVLVTGETGTGKELVARTIHEQSRRARKAMVHVNCAALPESIAESELFGHIKGAFTGALADRLGKFELAENGTLFLDEVGELAPSLQAKLLRALQFGEIQRVGSDKAKRVDVRIVAATNRDLEKEVAAGRFREDLYHRLSVYPIEMPPLRARLDDVDVLAGYFLERHRSKLGTPPLRLGSDALERLKAYPWPGNVREFEHVLMRAALRAQARQASNDQWVILEPKDLMLPQERDEVEASDLATATKQFQQNLVRQTLERAEQNHAEAARLLGMDRSNFHRLVKRLELR